MKVIKELKDVTIGEIMAMHEKYCKGTRADGFYFGCDNCPLHHPFGNFLNYCGNIPEKITPNERYHEITWEEDE